jgi:hypothetical protein
MNGFDKKNQFLNVKNKKFIRNQMKNIQNKSAILKT